MRMLDNTTLSVAPSADTDGRTTAAEMMELIENDDPSLIFTDMRTGKRVSHPRERFPEAFAAPKKDRPAAAE
jgi:hypothetical protein